MPAATGPSAALIGADWNPFLPDELADPYPFYERARSEAPVLHSPLLDLWVLTRYDDVAAALRDTQRFSSEGTAPKKIPITPEAFAILGPGGLYPGPNAVRTDPPGHQRLRSPLDPSFTAPRLAALEPEIRRRAHELVDRMTTGTEADLVAGLAYPLPLSVVIALFGASQDNLESFQRWTHNLISFMTTIMSPDDQLVAAHGIVEYHDFLLGLIAENRANPGNDLTSDIVHAQSDPPFSDGELVSTLTGLLFAGHPTIACLIGNAAMLFLDPRSRWEAPRGDRSLVPGGGGGGPPPHRPGPLGHPAGNRGRGRPRHHHPAGERVLLLSSAANRDEAQFPDPTEYQPGRANASSHLTFVDGPHRCAGRALARLEARIAFEVLLDRLPGLRLVAGQTLVHLPTLVIRGVRSLQVTWD